MEASRHIGKIRTMASSQRQLPAFVLRDENQEDKERGGAEDEERWRAAQLLLEREVGPLERSALRKHLVGQLFHALQRRAGGDARRRSPLHLGSRKQVVARHAIRDRLAPQLRYRPIVELLQEGDDLARTMSLLDAGVDHARQKVDAGQQRAMPDIFMVPRQTRMARRDGRQVRRRRSNRLHAGLLVEGHDRDRRDLALVREGRLLQQLDLAIDAQDLGHLGVEFRIAALEIIAHLVRLDLVRREDLAQRALSEPGEAFVPRRRAVFANVLGKQPRRPQFVGITEVLGFSASQVDNEGPRFVSDDRLPPRPRTVVERRQDAQSFGSPDKRSTV